MLQSRDAKSGAAPAPVYIEGLLYNGVDYAAARRAHSRELTTARQAAERRSARAAVEGAYGAAEVRAELARISAAHRTWLQEHGEDVHERPARKRRSSVRALEGHEEHL